MSFVTIQHRNARLEYDIRTENNSRNSGGRKNVDVEKMKEEDDNGNNKRNPEHVNFKISCNVVIYEKVNLT